MRGPREILCYGVDELINRTCMGRSECCFSESFFRIRCSRDNLSRYVREECHGHVGFIVEDMGTGRAVMGQKVVPVPATRVEGG